MISPEHFIEHLESRGFHFFTGVPCSYFQPVILLLKDRRTSSYCIAPNEGSALALASGAYLGDKDACVMIQNSGLGNLINPLTSLNLTYHVPVLLFVSGRAYGIPDEPQHEIMGKEMPQLLRCLGVRHSDLSLEEENFRDCLDQGIQAMRSQKVPVVFFVRKGTFAAHAPISPNVRAPYPLKRVDAIAIIRDCLGPEDLLFSTTGKPSRELFAVGDRPGNFYMQGSMGHIGSLALGTAISKPDRRVVIIDGDGAAIMHMGTLSMIGHYRPANFYHLVLDNESYETTGDQDTTSSTTDFAAIAEHCGYRHACNIQDADELRSRLQEILRWQGPVLVRIKINRLPTKDIPRITTRYQAQEIASSFKRHVAS